MRVLLYKDLNTRRVKSAFAKLRAFLEADDFRSAEVKKLSPTPYWRAKLDYSNRLLLQFARDKSGRNLFGSSMGRPLFSSSRFQSATS